MLLIAADTASSSLRLLTFDSTDPIDIGWLLSYLAWGAAALHPSMVSLSATAPDTETTFTRRRLAALTVAVLVAPADPGRRDRCSGSSRASGPSCSGPSRSSPW